MSQKTYKDVISSIVENAISNGHRDNPISYFTLIAITEINQNEEYVKNFRDIYLDVVKEFSDKMAREEGYDEYLILTNKEAAATTTADYIASAIFGKNKFVGFIENNDSQANTNVEEFLKVPSLILVDVFFHDGVPESVMARLLLKHPGSGDYDFHNSMLVYKYTS